MIEQIKAMKLEDMAETAREIVEEGKDTDPDPDYNNNSKEFDARQLKKLRKKLVIPRSKRYQNAKMRGFKKELANLYDNC